MRKPLFIAKQSRHPSGLMGQVVARVMSRETVSDNDHAIQLLDVESTDRVLDVGTGHGATIIRLARLAPQGHVTGVDNSDVMLSVASRTNRSFIDEGLVTLARAGSEDMPFEDNAFNKVLSVHTLYFWDPIDAHLAEISRVLHPGGRLVLGFRPAEDVTMVAKFPASVYQFLCTEDVISRLASVGLLVCKIDRLNQPGRSMVWIVSEKECDCPSISTINY